MLSSYFFAPLFLFCSRFISGEWPFLHRMSRRTRFPRWMDGCLLDSFPRLLVLHFAILSRLDPAQRGLAMRTPGLLLLCPAALPSRPSILPKSLWWPFLRGSSSSACYCCPCRTPLSIIISHCKPSLFSRLLFGVFCYPPPIICPQLSVRHSLGRSAPGVSTSLPLSFAVNNC